MISDDYQLSNNLNFINKWPEMTVGSVGFQLIVA